MNPSNPPSYAQAIEALQCLCQDITYWSTPSGIRINLSVFAMDPIQVEQPTLAQALAAAMDRLSEAVAIQEAKTLNLFAAVQRAQEAAQTPLSLPEKTEALISVGTLSIDKLNLYQTEGTLHVDVFQIYTTLASHSSSVIESLWSILDKDFSALLDKIQAAQIRYENGLKNLAIARESLTPSLKTPPKNAGPWCPKCHWEFRDPQTGNATKSPGVFCTCDGCSETVCPTYNLDDSHD